MPATTKKISSRLCWPSRLWSLLGAVILVAGISFISWNSLRLDPPKPAEYSGFSAVRAIAAARSVLGNLPRPGGSAANSAAVQRLKEYFISLGYEPQEQIAKIKVRGHSEIEVRNIFVRKEGRTQLPAIVLVSHHDSVPISPGGSDNGMGVAVCLDAARMLANQETLERPVIILITDCEELGLVGARLFAQNHPWSNDIGAVINIDNRGGDGAAQLFETGPNDLALIHAIAPFVTHPVMSSFFVEIYRRMPNGTDLTAFLERGHTGINIACDAAVERYHTSEDTFDNVNLESLQHQGELATQALLGLCAMPVEAVPSETAVFIDVFGYFLVAWSASSGVIMSILMLAGVVRFYMFCSHQSRGSGQRRAQLWNRGFVRGVLGAATALVATAVSVMALAWLAQKNNWYGLEYADKLFATQNVPAEVRENWAAKFAAAYWPPHAIVLSACMAAACIPISWLTTRWVLIQGAPWESWCGVWFALALLNLMIAIAAPGASVIVLPVVLAAVCSAWASTIIFHLHSMITPLLSLLIPIAVASAIYAPLEVLGWQGVGLSMPLFRGLLSGFYAVFLLMLFVKPPQKKSSTHYASESIND